MPYRGCSRTDAAGGGPPRPPASPSRNVTKRSLAEPARPALSIPIAVEARNPLEEHLRTTIELCAHLELALRRAEDRRPSKARRMIIW